MSSLPECACPILLGSPCDIERVERITSRTMDYILDLEKAGQLNRTDWSANAPAGIASMTNWPSACLTYLEAINRSNQQLVTTTLFLLVKLCELENQFAELGYFIPHDGGPLECYYLKRVVEICPGE